MEAFLQLIKEKRVDLEKVTTHKFKIENAQGAYDLITGKKKGKFVGVLLEYCHNKESNPIVKIKDNKRKKTGNINIGLIGAGNFAQSTILPILKNFKDINLEGVLTSKSHLAQNIAKKFGINRCFSEADSILTDKSINTIIIVTRHDLHAHFVIEGLRNKENIYVEKPLAMNISELKEIIKVHNEIKKDIFVGFNRRFSPHIEKCKEFFIKRKSPMFIIYRINAGFIPADHWIQSNVEGGGRIIGEVCHFVDLCQFLCQLKFKSIFAQNIGNDKLRDNITITIKFDDGSIANVNYLSNGDKSYSKERIEIFCQDSIAIIDDFRKLELIREGRRKVYKSAQNKGHQKQLELWIKNIKENEPIPVPFIESVNSTIATFMIHESLNKGKIIYFNEYSPQFFK